jgi:hypothetical protein
VRLKGVKYVSFVSTSPVNKDRLQPAFFASLAKHPYTLTGINDVVKFDDVRINRGQGYNPSTGVFTAPLISKLPWVI